MLSEEEAALIEELRNVLSPWLTVEGVLSRASAAERRVSAEFADPQVSDEQAVRRAVEQNGALIALHSPTFLTALGLLREKSARYRAVHPHSRAYDEIRAAVTTFLDALAVEIAPARGRGRPRGSRQDERAWRVEILTRRYGLTEAEAVEQVRRDEKTSEAGIKKSLQRHRRKLPRGSSDK
jgi:hypothetical protein